MKNGIFGLFDEQENKKSNRVCVALENNDVEFINSMVEATGLSASEITRKVFLAGKKRIEEQEAAIKEKGILATSFDLITRT